MYTRFFFETPRRFHHDRMRVVGSDSSVVCFLDANHVQTTWDRIAGGEAGQYELKVQGVGKGAKKGPLSDARFIGEGTKVVGMQTIHAVRKR